MKTLLYISLIFSGLIFISCESDKGSNLATIGKGGSMARFAIGQHHLYLANNYSIQVFELGSNGSITFKNTILVDMGIETIFLHGQNLFLGATDAMYTYTIADPAKPAFVSRYDHIVSCDPVVVNDNYAYVTLRVQASCREAGADALEIIDISNTALPKLIKSYPVTSPYGLGVDGNTLFVCEGDNGLKIYDVEKPNAISLIKHYEKINSFDVIPNAGTLIMTGDDGIFQYDYTNLSDVQLLSHITVQ